MSYQLIVGIFADDTEAAVTQLERYHKSQDKIAINEAVAIIKTIDGKDEMKIMGDPKKKARRIGALAGALLGVLGGPVTMAVLGLGGAAAGDLIAKLTHSGISKKMITAIEDGLQPGSSAVIVIVEQATSQLIVKDLKESGAYVLSEMVESDVIEGKYLISPGGGISETK